MRALVDLALPHGSPSKLAVYQPRRVRIVYLSGTAQLGGAERCLLDVMESVRTVPVQPTLVAASYRVGRWPSGRPRTGGGVCGRGHPLLPRGSRYWVIRGAGGSVWRLVAVAARTVGALGAIARYRLELRRALHRLQPDVVHTNGYKTHILGAWTRPAKASLVWHLHDYISTRPAMAWILRQHAFFCRAGIAVSASVGVDARAACRRRFPVHVVPNGVNLEEFRPEGPRADLDRFGRASTGARQGRCA